MDTYRFRGETVAGREPNNLMVEFRVFNVTKKIEVVYRLRKKAVTDPEAVYIAFPFEVEGGKIHLDVPGGSIEGGCRPKSRVPLTIGTRCKTSLRLVTQSRKS